MSHFSLMVVTDSQPSEEDLQKIMQPWHEFECTGDDDQYIQDIDKTEEARKEYESSTERKLRDPQGNYYCPYDEQFYREPTEEEKAHIGPIAGSGYDNGISWSSRKWSDGSGYHARVRFVPEDYEEVEIPVAESKSFAEFIEDYYGSKPLVLGKPRQDKHKYGFYEVDSEGEVLRVIDRTNPNKKWDYWRIGGRYRSKIQAKPKANALSTDPSWEWSQDRSIPEGYDQVCIGDIDRERMKQVAVQGRRDWANKCAKKAGVTLEQLELGCHQERESHTKWMELEEPRPRGAEYYDWSESQGYAIGTKVKRANWDIPELKEGESLEEWIQAAPSLTSFAVVLDGKWYERGEMGWWACVSNENEDWDAEFKKLFSSLNDNQWITILDCHI